MPSVCGGCYRVTYVYATFCSSPKMQNKTVLETCIFTTNLSGIYTILFGFDQYIAYCLFVAYRLG